MTHLFLNVRERTTQFRQVLIYLESRTTLLRFEEYARNLK